MLTLSQDVYLLVPPSPSSAICEDLHCTLCEEGPGTRAVGDRRIWGDSGLGYSSVSTCKRREMRADGV